MIRTRPAAVFLAALLVGVLSCSTAFPSAIRNLTMSVLLPSPTISVGNTVAVTAVIRDAAGDTARVGEILWTSSNPAVAIVNAAQVTALSAGTTQIKAASDGMTAAATLSVVAAPAVAVASVSVTLATGTLTVGQTTQATATARDATNIPLTGRAVAWSSDNTGIASVSTSGVVTSVAAGAARITATSEGVNGSAVATIADVPPVPVATVSVALNAGAIVVGQNTQATATMRDASNAVLSGRVVSWTTDNSAIAIVSSAGLVTGVSGGTATITATSEGKSGNGTVQVTVVPPVVGAASQLAVTTQPAGVVSGVTLTPSPAVQVRDAAGNLVTTSAAQVTAALSSATGTLVGVTTVNAVNGTATFATLRVNGAGPNALTFTASGLASASSATFTVTQTSAALQVATQPSGATTGLPLTTQPVVRILDNAGLLVSTAALSVRAAVTSGSGTLSGTTTVAAVNGVASFTNLRLDGSGAHVLTFSTTAPALQVGSASFVAAVGAATRLTLTTQPSTAATSGVTMAQQPVVQLRDAVNGAVSQAGVVVTAAIATGGGTLSGTTTATTNASGVAAFSGLTLTGVDGIRTVSFTAAGLTAVTSGTISVTTPVIPPPAGAGEPVYNATTQRLLWKDDFDSYTTFAEAVAAGWRGTDGATTPDTRGNPAGANQFVGPGYDGAGRAIRLVYNGYDTGAGQEARSWSRVVTDATAAKPGRAFYISYYYRIVPGGGARLDQDASHIVKVKWLELWRADGGDRAQFNTSYSQCVNDVPFAGASGSGTLFQFYGTGGGNTSCQAGQVRAPYAYLGAGQWHRATHKYVTQSAPGARDGIAQMWVDGVLVVSVASGYCGVAVPGGTGGQPWCTTADLDAMLVQETVSKITLGSVQTAALWPFAIDYDHMSLWRDP